MTGDMRYWTVLLAILVPAMLCLSAGKRLTRPVALDDFEPVKTHFRVDVNQTDVATLTLLPDIGPQLARRIVAYREEERPFAGLGDLEKVSGIGPMTAARISPFIHFGTPSEPPDSSPFPSNPVESTQNDRR